MTKQATGSLLKGALVIAGVTSGPAGLIDAADLFNDIASGTRFSGRILRTTHLERCELVPPRSVRALLINNFTAAITITQAGTLRRMVC